MNTSNSPHDPAIRSPALAAVLVLMALFVPWLTLTWVGVRQYDGWPAVAVPFGLGRILTAHLLASLPMGMWIAWRTRRLAAHRNLAIGAGSVGILLAGISLLIADPLANWAVSGDVLPLNDVALPGTRGFLVRTVWVLVLQLPWCLAAVTTMSNPQQKRVPYWADVVTALLLLAIPAVYTTDVVRRQSRLVADARANQQYQKALEITHRLYVLRPPTIAGEEATTLLTRLGSQVQALSKEVQQPLPADPTIDQVLTRALHWYGLGEYDAMRTVLGTLPQFDPRASYQLARGYEAQGNWLAAVDQYRTTIRIIATASEGQQSTPALRKTLRSSYERLVNNLRRAGEYAAAESELKEGLKQWPTHRDLFLLQLGFHYQLAGRTAEAVDYFQQASQANPQLQGVVDQQLANLDRQAQGCLLRSPQAATR